MKRRAIRFRVDEMFIRQAFHMPDDCRVFGCEWDFSNETMTLYVESDKFPELVEGQSVPYVTPSLERVFTNLVKFDFRLDATK